VDFLECFSNAKLDQRPSLLETINLLKKEASNYTFGHSVDVLSELKEKVLELEELFLSECEPFFLAEFVSTNLKLFEETPSFVLFFELFLHFVVVRHNGHVSSEVLAVTLDFSESFGDHSPVSS
jgi:hypothetical protein